MCPQPRGLRGAGRLSGNVAGGRIGGGANLCPGCVRRGDGDRAIRKRSSGLSGSRAGHG